MSLRAYKDKLKRVSLHKGVLILTREFHMKN